MSLFPKKAKSQTHQPQLDNGVARESFKWLFRATFDDGTVIEQTQEDKSALQPSGSAFTDVVSHESRPTIFSLVNQENGDEVSVDLKTGNFMANGLAVCAHGQFFEPLKYDLDLVYFRETRVDSETNVDGDVKIVRHYVNRYFIGWKAVVNGKDKQVTIAVG